MRKATKATGNVPISLRAWLMAQRKGSAMPRGHDTAFESGARARFAGKLARKNPYANRPGILSWREGWDSMDAAIRAGISFVCDCCGAVKTSAPG